MRLTNPSWPKSFLGDLQECYTQAVHKTSSAIIASFDCRVRFWNNIVTDNDEILYNQQAAKVLELLFKSTASGELGEFKTAKKFTKAAYNIIGNILWSPDSVSTQRSRDSQTSQDSSIIGELQEETSSLDKLRKKLMVRDENVRENIGLSKEISRLISSDDSEGEGSTD